MTFYNVGRRGASVVKTRFNAENKLKLIENNVRKVDMLK